VWGAVLGAVSINWLRSVLTATYPTLWPIILGGLFVVVVMFFPSGLMGMGRRLAALRTARRRGAAEGSLATSSLREPSA
jgi:urea transport system permease protein